MSSAFIADLHLHAQHPELLASATRFFAHARTHFKQVYVLGDLWEYWIGDDAPLAGIESAQAALEALATQIPVYFCAGNRDFLYLRGSAHPATASSAPPHRASTPLHRLADEHLIDTPQQRIVLLHGDTLCTDDQDYQRARTLLRSGHWQQQFLAQTAEQRLAKAQALRQDSQRATLEKNATPSIMDVNAEAVSACFLRHDCSSMIHGHTHRPFDHQHTLPNHKPVTRHVLGDWQIDGSAEYLQLDERGHLTRHRWSGHDSQLLQALT